MAVILLGTALIAAGFFVRVGAAARLSRIAAIGAAQPRQSASGYSRPNFEGTAIARRSIYQR
jgi:hypothetical protein